MSSSGMEGSGYAVSLAGLGLEAVLEAAQGSFHCLRPRRTGALAVPRRDPVAGGKRPVPREGGFRFWARECQMALAEWTPPTEGGTMSAVTTGEAHANAGLPFTVAELDRLPNNGRRYELLDGVLVVSPRPTTIHQAVAGRLYGLLSDVCPEDLLVVPEPALQLTAKTEFVPDLVVVPIDEVGDAKFTSPPLLVVEVRSPSTAIIDLNRKKTAYERFGVPSYWIVNPDLAQPDVTVFELRDGHYATVAVTTASLTVERPFPITITPAQLTSRLRPRGTEAG